jgi:hypothetical protein
MVYFQEYRMGDILGVNPRKPLGYSNHLGFGTSGRTSVRTRAIKTLK